MPVLNALFSIAVVFLSSCATWHEERAAARTLAKVQESLKKVPNCNGEQLASALLSVPVDAPGGAVVTLRGNIRIGLEKGRFAHCLGNELVGCAPYTGPWVLLPAAGGAEFVELYAAGGDEMGWVSREGAVKTLTDLPLANVIVTGKLGSPLQPEERARGGRRTMSIGRMCKVDS